MPSTSVQIDPRDVATVLALEHTLSDFVAAIRKAEPALERLKEAAYPGASRIHDDFLDMLGEGHSDSAPKNVRESLDLFRVAAGDRAAYDYQDFMKGGELSMDEAAAEMIDCYGATEEALERIAALKSYAATVGAAQKVIRRRQDEQPLDSPIPAESR
jgi:hypothetical protein